MSDFTVSRAKFVDGMLLIAEDLTLEQHYFDRRLRQIERGNGWGVFQGLKVAAADGKLTISPGYAIDAQGFEVVLDEIRDVAPRDGVLSIRRTAPKELTASEISKMACTSSNAGVVVYRRVEQAEVQIRDPAEPVQDGWVPLAFVKSGKVSIASRVTVISELGWNHDAQMNHWPECWIKFSAPVTKAPAQALDVRMRGAGGTETIVPVALELIEECTKLEFKLEPATRKKRIRESETVFIRLSCDFILDWKGDPVSGAHLRGEAPGGVGGGLFESWFTISERGA